MSDLVLRSPLSGWAMPLEEVPDEVFAGKMMGDGLAIDPVDAILMAPCEGTLTSVSQSAHAVTIRAVNEAELLLHLGIDTVNLKGAGFTPLVRSGQTVQTGEPLIRFDLELLARNAKSLVTPVIVTQPDRFRIVERHAPGRLHAGDRLMSVRSADVLPAPGAEGRAGTAVSATIVVKLQHGLHARPAALVAQSIRNLRADATLSLRERSANVRSAVALMSLGASHGDRLTLRASGVDAALVQAAVERALARAHSLAGRTGTPLANPVRPPMDSAAELGGIAASPGLALGTAVRMARAEPEVAERGRGAERELQRLDDARERLRKRMTRFSATDDGARAGILGAHLEFLDDPELLTSAHEQIAQGKSAGHAWRVAIRKAIDELSSVEDAHLAARVDDLRDLELQLLEMLAGAAEPKSTPLPDRAILLARDLLPSQFLALDAARIAGVCTVSRATTSHVAILAGAMGLPMLTGMEAALLSIADGTPLLLDADHGRLAIAPDFAATVEAESRIAEHSRIQARLLTAAAIDCRTADGERIEVFANVGSVAEAVAAVTSGAEGCGLLRTEFMFLDRADAPDSAEQSRHYQQVVEAFAGRPVIVRTLDAGSDKSIPFIAMPQQDNPALGLRGIRASLWRPDLLRSQIAAILAVRPAENCRILLPMVNEVAEILAVRRMIEEIAAGSHGNERIPLGIMIETPASAINAARLAPHADFFSIGTNDLTQYVLAIDRTHPLLAADLDALHPAVLRLIGSVCSVARAAGRGVAVCGSLASDPLAAPVLVGLGVGELSAVPAAIPAVKDRVSRHTLSECRALAQEALELDSAAAVRGLLAEFEAGDRS